MWAELKRFSWQWRGAWIAAPPIALLVILLRFTGILQPWEWAVFDQYLRLRPTEERDDRVAIVGINEADIRALKQAIIPDRVYAQLIEKLKAMEPRAIGLDIYRDLPVQPGHEQLVEVFDSTPNLVGIEKVLGDRAFDKVAPPPTLKAKGQVGSNDIIVDADNKIRRTLLSLPEPDSEGTIPSLGMFLAALYLDPEGYSLQTTEPPQPNTLQKFWRTLPFHDPETIKPEWQIGDTVLSRFLANDGGYIRADAGGNQILINYRGATKHFESVSLMDILEDRVSADWGRDRVILIGMVGESSKDYFYTPYSSSLLSLPEPMYGVEIHAQVTSQVISAVLDDRPFFHSWSEPAEWLWIFFWSGLGATFAWKMRHAGTGKTKVLILQQVGFVTLAASVLVGSTYAALLQGWWIPIVPPMLAMVASAGVIITYIARTAGDIRKTFGRYLTDQVVANLLENPEGLKMGGERRKITILTSDLRGFTALSERLSPEKVVKILNFYLGEMAETITQYQGTIDEFMGDGILVLFGAPTVREDDPTRAIACAIAMQQAMTRVNEQMQAWNLPNLEMGIGINTGEVVVGNIGSEKRTKYGVVGSQVNLTYRIESYTIGGQVLISETTLQGANAEIKINGQKEVSPKGVKKPITIYDVGGIGGHHNLYLAQEEETFLPLPQAIALQYAVLDGKNIGDLNFPGHLVKLSAKGGEIHLNGHADSPIPPALSNIKLNFFQLVAADQPSEDTYGKVLEKCTEEGGFYIQFTSKPPKVAKKLQEIYQKIEVD